MAYKISDDCISCGACAAECPVEAISEGDGKYEIDADKCIDCGTCANAGPGGAAARGGFKEIKVSEDVFPAYFFYAPKMRQSTHFCSFRLRRYRRENIFRRFSIKTLTFYDFQIIFISYQLGSAYFCTSQQYLSVGKGLLDWKTKQ